MKGKHNKFLKYFSPALVWGVFILILSGIPGNAFPTIPSFLDWLRPDKIIHLFIYCVFGCLLQFGFDRQFSEKKKRFFIILLTLVIGILFGAITEIMQFFIFVGRNGSIFDFCANVLGCLLGILIYYLIFLKKLTKT